MYISSGLDLAVIDKDMTFGDLMAFQTYIFTIGGGLAGVLATSQTFSRPRERPPAFRAARRAASFWMPSL